MVFYHANNILGFYNERVVTLLQINEDKTLEVLFRLKSNEYFNSVTYNHKNSTLVVNNAQLGVLKIYNVTKGK